MVLPPDYFIADVSVKSFIVAQEGASVVDGKKVCVSTWRNVRSHLPFTMYDTYNICVHRLCFKVKADKAKVVEFMEALADLGDV